jgi:catechol 2,3-dioxygenase-like lactoylglutathione lyase family enzyme
MKGDEKRAELLATMLDGGPVSDEIEPLTPAVRRVREMLHRLAPDPERVAELLPQLLERSLERQRRPSIELAHTTLYVCDMDAALTFYRDALGLTVNEQGKWVSVLEAGTARIALHWTGRTARKPRLGDVQLEFRSEDLDASVLVLRRRSIPVDVKIDRHRGRFAELHDPDGHLVVLLGGTVAAQRVSTPENQSAMAARRETDE